MRGLGGSFMKVDIRSKNRLNLCQSSGHASSDLRFLQSSLKYQKGERAQFRLYHSTWKLLYKNSGLRVSARIFETYNKNCNLMPWHFAEQHQSSNCDWLERPSTEIEGPRIEQQKMIVDLRPRIWACCPLSRQVSCSVKFACQLKLSKWKYFLRVPKWHSVMLLRQQ